MVDIHQCFFCVFVLSDALMSPLLFLTFSVLICFHFSVVSVWRGITQIERYNSINHSEYEL